MAAAALRCSLRDVACANDAFRMGVGEVPGKIVFTEACRDDSGQVVEGLLEAVRRCRHFDKDAVEHDMGFVWHRCFRYLFKIDYFGSAACDYGGDPFNEPVYRVMTIMQAEDY